MQPARFVCVALLTATSALLAGGTANASSGSLTQPQLRTASTAAGSIGINYKITRFAIRGHGLIAYGTANARYVPGSAGGKASIVRTPFKAGVKINSARKRGLSSAQTTCSILTLDLQQLDLNLLGLDVHADRVFLTLTGDTSGGLLGNLLCGLANSGKLTTQASKLNWAVHKSGLAVSGTGYTVGVQPPAPSADRTTSSARTTQSPAAALTLCPVLDLTLGPLDANLLGLVVHLDQVHLTIVADSTGGILGSLFCQVFNGGTPTG
jgi:hypothetical protein